MNGFGIRRNEADVAPLMMSSSLAVTLKHSVSWLPVPEKKCGRSGKPSNSRKDSADSAIV